MLQNRTTKTHVIHHSFWVELWCAFVLELLSLSLVCVCVCVFFSQKKKKKKTHDTIGCISSFKCVILMRKRLNLKLEWIKNYDTKIKTLSHTRSACDEASFLIMLMCKNVGYTYIHTYIYTHLLALCTCDARLNQNSYVNSFFFINLLKIR